MDNKLCNFEECADGYWEGHSWRDFEGDHWCMGNNAGSISRIVSASCKECGYVSGHSPFCPQSPMQSTLPDTFQTKDSGERIEFDSGMHRDTNKGKPRYDLIPPNFLKRWAELMARGAEKYGDRNWEQANSQTELDRFKESAFRHFMQWYMGETDEDHGVAVAYNISAHDHIKEREGL